MMKRLVLLLAPACVSAPPTPAEPALTLFADEAPDRDEDGVLAPFDCDDGRPDLGAVLLDAPAGDPDMEAAARASWEDTVSITRVGPGAQVTLVAREQGDAAYLCILADGMLEIALDTGREVDVLARRAATARPGDLAFSAVGPHLACSLLTDHGSPFEIRATDLRLAEGGASMERAQPTATPLLVCEASADPSGEDDNPVR